MLNKMAEKKFKNSSNLGIKSESCHLKISRIAKNWLMIFISDELMVEFSHRRNRNEYLFEDNPEFYLYFGMFFLCALLIITWSYFECTDSESVTKAGF